MLEALQVVAGVLLVFFLPGYTFVNLLFPRRNELDPEYDVVYRLALSMGLSVVMAIIIGFSLNAVSTEDQAYVRPGPLWLAFLSVTGVFFLAGWVRGAYPWMERIHPSLYRPEPARKVAGVKMSPEKRNTEAGKLLIEQERLKKELQTSLERSSTSNPQRKLHYRRRTDRLRERIGQIDRELDAMRSEERD
ncbi:MAG: DUF1616 domain-containing protein [Thermoplasmata archaeon]|jgi:hypothetical protein|nr:DUF1616 domain-containing protein [Thermoplasmata archaeon]